jgi:hypothetical protein
MPLLQTPDSHQCFVVNGSMIGGEGYSQSGYADFFFNMIASHLSERSLPGIIVCPC